MLADAEAEQECEDARAMQAVARRDVRAFRLLVDRHAPWLFALAWRMLADRHEAEDVVQESLLRLWDHAASWQPKGGGLQAWLRRVATNQCLDRLRRRARFSREEPPERPDEDPAADVAFDSASRDRLAITALRSLPDRQRAAIVLTYYEQLSNAESAAVLGLGVKAFESLLLRARGALRAVVVRAGITAESLRETP